MLCDNPKCKADLSDEFCVERVVIEGNDLYLQGHCNICSTFHSFRWYKGENMVTLQELD